MLSLEVPAPQSVICALQMGNSAGPAAGEAQSVHGASPEGKLDRPSSSSALSVSVQPGSARLPMSRWKA